MKFEVREVGVVALTGKGSSQSGKKVCKLGAEMKFGSLQVSMNNNPFLVFV